MATNYVLYTSDVDVNTPDGVSIDITTGGTLTPDGVVLNIVFDEDVFTGALGKKRLILSLEAMTNKLKQSSTTWPLT